MSGDAFKIIEITGVSDKSQDAAIETAIKKAAETLHNLAWFEVLETRGAIKDGKVSEYQVVLKVAFQLD